MYIVSCMLIYMEMVSLEKMLFLFSSFKCTESVSETSPWFKRPCLLILISLHAEYIPGIILEYNIPRIVLTEYYSVLLSTSEY